jgi:hypothetical protein
MWIYTDPKIYRSPLFLSESTAGKTKTYSTAFTVALDGGLVMFANRLALTEYQWKGMETVNGKTQGGGHSYSEGPPTAQTRQWT